jgi:restriction endonuclease Mrr
MTLDPEVMHRLIAHAKAARMAQEVATLVLPKPAPAPAPPVPEAAPVRAATEPLLAPPVAPAAEPEVAAEVAAEVPAEIVPEEEVSEPAPRPAKARGPGWRARVSSRMTRITEQREEDRVTYRGEILAAVRNLSWDGYTALIADVYRRKAFEVFPPPAAGSDLDVIDLVVDRDGQRMLVNCQLRGEMAIPVAAVTEMATVVANYSVSGAYLIADGSFGPDAEEAAPRGGVVLIDGEALIDLVIETTLKDERKPSVGGRLARVFARKN